MFRVENINRIIMILWAPIYFLYWVIFTLPVYASVPDTAFDNHQQEDIGRIALDYLLTHPEFFDAIEKVRQKKVEEAEDRILAGQIKSKVLQHDKIVLNSGQAPFAGSLQSKIIIVQFFDYQCAACRNNSAVIQQAIDNKIPARIIFRDWTPVLPHQSNSNGETAAAIGLSIWKDKGVESYLSYRQAALSAGLNVQGFAIENIVQGLKAASAPVPTPAKMVTARKLLANNAKLAKILGLTKMPILIVLPVAAANDQNVSVLSGLITEKMLADAMILASK